MYPYMHPDDHLRLIQRRLACLRTAGSEKKPGKGSRSLGPICVLAKLRRRARSLEACSARPQRNHH